MNMKLLSTAALAAAFALPGGMAATAHAAAAAAAPGFYQERGWDQPPEEYREVQKQGFHDGIDAARRDFEQHARKDADDHDRFRRPPVQGSLRNDYREGFKRGYDMAKRHMQDEHHDRD